MQKPNQRIQLRDYRSYGTVCLGLGLLLAGFSTQAATPTVTPFRDIRQDPTLRMITSSSGQFTTAAPSTLLASAPSRTQTNSALINLSPQTLAVSCERIKHALLSELHIQDAWQGRIHVIINPQMRTNQPALIGARSFTDGWSYQVEVPSRMDRSKLIRGVVHSLLLELANRATSPRRSTAIPLWLSEGLTQLLIHSSLADLAVARPTDRINGVLAQWRTKESKAPDPLADVRAHIVNDPLLSFTQMGELELDEMSEGDWINLQISSHLFVYELLRLNPTSPKAANLILNLPRYLNWQLAFLDTYQDYFPNLLDVEKWWSVVIVHFSDYNTAHSWSLEVANRKLEEILAPSVLVNDDEDTLPHRTRLPLQQLLEDWDYSRQRPVLLDAQRQLMIQRMRMPPDLIEVADKCVQALESYLSSQDRLDRVPTLPGLRANKAQRLVRAAVDKLNDLDQQRERILEEQAAGTPTSNTATNAPAISPAPKDPIPPVFRPPLDSDES